MSICVYIFRQNSSTHWKISISNIYIYIYVYTYTNRLSSSCIHKLFLECRNTCKQINEMFASTGGIAWGSYFKFLRRVSVWAVSESVSRGSLWSPVVVSHMVLWLISRRGLPYGLCQMVSPIWSLPKGLCRMISCTLSPVCPFLWSLNKALSIFICLLVQLTNQVHSFSNFLDVHLLHRLAECTVYDNPITKHFNPSRPKADRPWFHWSLWSRRILSVSFIPRLWEWADLGHLLLWPPGKSLCHLFHRSAGPVSWPRSTSCDGRP